LRRLSTGNQQKKRAKKRKVNAGNDSLISYF